MAQQWTEPIGRGRRAPDVGVTPATPSEVLHEARRWLQVAGVLALIGGAVAVAVPALASVATAIFIGWILIFAGVMMGIDAYSQRHRGGIGLPVLMAALALLIGIYLVAFPL